MMVYDKIFVTVFDVRCFIFSRQHMPFDDLNESTIVEFTEESSDDENIDNAGNFTYTPENLEADDEEESDNILCG